jgi:hypothetical protein
MGESTATPDPVGSVARWSIPRSTRSGPPLASSAGPGPAFLASLSQTEQSTNSCPSPVIVYRLADGERVSVPCRSRRCSVCGPTRWRPVKLAKLHAGLKGDREEYLVLLLTAPGDAGAEWNERASARWHHFAVLLRREYPGADVAFWRVAELQERDLIHYHVVLRGLRFLPVGTFRRLATQAGFGGWVGVRRPSSYPGGVRGLGGYLGKYLLKDVLRSMPNRARLVTMSQAWALGWVKRVRTSTGAYLWELRPRESWSEWSARAGAAPLLSSSAHGLTPRCLALLMPWAPDGARALAGAPGRRADR